MKGGTVYKQKDIVLIPFPYSDLTGAKLRPALIISNDALRDDHICCLVTSKPNTEGIAITKNAYRQGTLPFPSKVKPHRVFTIDTRIVRKRLCSVTPAFHKSVLSAIDAILQDKD